MKQMPEFQKKKNVEQDSSRCRGKRYLQDLAASVRYRTQGFFDLNEAIVGATTMLLQISGVTDLNLENFTYGRFGHVVLFREARLRAISFTRVQHALVSAPDPRDHFNIELISLRGTLALPRACD
jgi:hypothetical protein